MWNDPNDDLVIGDQMMDYYSIELSGANSSGGIFKIQEGKGNYFKGGVMKKVVDNALQWILSGRSLQ